MPARVILYRDTLTVEMSDASFCTGPRGAGRGDWQGNLAGCPHLWPYAAHPGPAGGPRRILTAAAPGPAQAELTTPAGRVLHYGSAE